MTLGFVQNIRPLSVNTPRRASFLHAAVPPTRAAVERLEERVHQLELQVEALIAREAAPVPSAPVSTPAVLAALAPLPPAPARPAAATTPATAPPAPPPPDPTPAPPPPDPTPAPPPPAAPPAPLPPAPGPDPPSPLAAPANLEEEVASLFAEMEQAHPPAPPVPEPPSSPAPTRATPAGQEDAASPAWGGAEAEDRDSSPLPGVGVRIVPAVPEEHEVKSMQPAVDSEDYTAGVGPPRPPGQRAASAAGSEALERARRSLRTTTLH